MKAIVKSAIGKLNKKQYDEFLNYYSEEMKTQIIQAVSTARYNWVRLLCIEMAEVYHWTDDEILVFLANFCKQTTILNRETSRGEDYEKGQEYISKKMTEIFGERGFPNEYYESKFGKVESEKEKKS